MSAWMILFEDSDVTSEMFTDEAAARARHATPLENWTCYLFVSDSELAALRAELAAEKERVATLTRQRDEMAAVLDKVRKTALECSITVEQLSPSSCITIKESDRLELVRDMLRDISRANPSAILDAALAKARREGAAGMGRKVQELARAGICLAASRDVSRALEGIEQAVECIILAIERGEVEA